jgi:hypothetical protein
MTACGCCQVTDVAGLWSALDQALERAGAAMKEMDEPDSAQHYSEKVRAEALVRNRPIRADNPRQRPYPGAEGAEASGTEYDDVVQLPVCPSIMRPDPHSLSFY